MVIKFILIFISTIVVVLIGLFFQSHVGIYKVYYIPDNVLDCNYGPMRAKNIKFLGGCAYHFSTSTLVYDKYMDYINNYGVDFNEENVFREDIKLSIENKKKEEEIYIGRVSVVDINKSCGFLIRNAKLKLCRPDLKSEIMENYANINFNKYYELLLEDGDEIVYSPQESGKYNEFTLRKEKVKGDLLYIGAIIYFDKNETCDYMVRNNKKTVCSKILYEEIRADIDDILPEKWLARFWMHLQWYI